MLQGKDNPEYQLGMGATGKVIASLLCLWASGWQLWETMLALMDNLSDPTQLFLGTA